VQNGAQISAATGSAGTAGTLNVNASESVEVSGFATGVDPSVEAVSFGIIGDGIVPSAIETNTRGAGKAGDLTIQTGRLTVRDGAEIGVRSTDTGLPGDLKVRADSILLDNQGRMSATSIQGQGGDIDLQVKQDLVLRNGSQISTQAGTEDTGGGNGGNITIKTGVLALFEKSSINANAFKGAGGNIRITTQGIFVSPDSSITASSTLGVNGVVEINQLGADPSQGLVELPVEVVDVTGLVATGCSADTGSSFVVTGRGGLPEDPTQTLRGQTVWRDLRPQRGAGGENIQGRRRELPMTRPQSPLVEATGWVRNAEGEVELVAHAPDVTPHNPWSRPPDCQTFNSQR
jgi:large exoprotein involved in heme utilization and adhesion